MALYSSLPILFYSARLSEAAPRLSKISPRFASGRTVRQSSPKFAEVRGFSRRRFFKVLKCSMRFDWFFFGVQRGSIRGSTRFFWVLGGCHKVLCKVLQSSAGFWQFLQGSRRFYQVLCRVLTRFKKNPPVSNKFSKVLKDAPRF